MDHRLSDLTDAQLQHVYSLDYVRYLSTLAACDNSALTARDEYLLRHQRSFSVDLVRRLPLVEKAGTTAGTSTDATWGAPLAVPKPWTDAIISLSAARGVRNKLGARAVPMNISVATQNAGGTFAWTPPAGPAPAGNLQLSTTTLGPAVASGIIVVSAELLKAATPSALETVRADLIRGMVTLEDDTLLGTGAANAATGTPAGLLANAPSFGSAGTSLANAQTDLKKLVTDWGAVNPNPDNLVIIMSPANAMKAAMATGSQTLTMQGGTLNGATVITSPSAGGRLLALDPGAVIVADPNDLAIDISKDATVEMNTAATSPQIASTILVSLWQIGCVGLRVRRVVNWKLTRASAALYTTVSWV